MICFILFWCVNDKDLHLYLYASGSFGLCNQEDLIQCYFSFKNIFNIVYLFNIVFMS